MSKHIEQKENIPQLSSKSLSKQTDHEVLPTDRLRDYCDQLIAKEYEREIPMQSVQKIRIIHFEKEGGLYPFRLFKESDLNFPPMPKAYRKFTQDDDVKSTSSVVERGKQQCQWDIAHAIHMRDRHLGIEANSMFASQILSQNSQYQSRFPSKQV